MTRGLFSVSLASFLKTKIITQIKTTIKYRRGKIQYKHILIFLLVLHPVFASQLSLGHWHSPSKQSCPKEGYGHI